MTGLTGCSLWPWGRAPEVTLPPVTVLPRPVMHGAGQVVPCEGGRQCAVLWLEDWQQFRAWALETERELKAACLALGHPPASCRAE